MNKSEIWKNYRFPIILLSGIMIGAVIGVIFGEKAKVLAPLGDIFLNLMFTIVVPMVFVSISSAVGNMVNMKRLGKILSSLVMVFVITGAIAGVLVLVVVNVFPPAAGTSIHFAGAEMEEMSGIGEMVVGALTVDDFSGLMSRKNMLPIIVFAILSGFCVSACGGEDSPVGRMLNNLNSIIMKIVSIIMLYAPIGLGAYFASLVGEFGPGLIGDYGHAMLVYYPMCILYFMAAFPAYSYFAGGKEGCDKIGVPRDIRDIVLPMGATMHMDGSVLSSIVKISFLFGIFGQSFTGIGTYAMAMAVAILSAFVLSGAPGGGLVGEMLIVSLFGFPAEAFPLIATIGFLVDPAATCLNASGDTIASMMVTRLVEGKDWLEKRIYKENSMGNTAAAQAAIAETK